MVDVDPVERAAREHWGRVLALLIGQFKRIDLAEDCLQDAFVAAARTWPDRGVPSNPGGWLLTTARRRAIDVLRAESTAARKIPLIIVDEETNARAAANADVPEIADERLRLIFTCCHPALPAPGSAALTLRLVAGLSVSEIARLFLVTETTMSARLTRAKRKIVAAGVPFAVPSRERLAERVDTVLAVIYLVFTEGYRATAGPQLVRTEVAEEAIRLAQVVDELVTDQPAVPALLALMTLQHSRRDSRLDSHGSLILLPDQDRTTWHHDEISSGLEYLARSMDGDPPASAERVARRYQLQALIAAGHATAPSADATDWTAIAAYYAELDELTESPIVRLNRAVAVAEADSPATAMALLEGLDDAIPTNHALPTVRGELLDRLGRRAEAVAAFDRALDLVTNDAERAHLLARRAEVAGNAS